MPCAWAPSRAEVEGLAKPLAGRLIALARLGRSCCPPPPSRWPIARRATRRARRTADVEVPGRWRFKGVPEAQEVFEVSEPGLAPLRMPAHAQGLATCRCGGAPVALAARRCWWPASRSTAGSSPGRSRRSPSTNATGWWSATCATSPATRAWTTLEQAFRISLEQSRYVNVLQRPQGARHAGAHAAQAGRPRGPQPGSEIALRDGARAGGPVHAAHRRGVGGRLSRVTPVIDPHTQTTVYAVSADGRGVESALGSIDTVTDQLREKLGEAMQNVQKTSVPACPMSPRPAWTH